MQNYITAMADSDRQMRKLTGGILVGAGATIAATAIASYADTPSLWNGRHPGWSHLRGQLWGCCFSVEAWRDSLSRPRARWLLRSSSQRWPRRENKPVAFAKTEEALEKLARRDRMMRNFGFWYYEASGSWRHHAGHDGTGQAVVVRQRQAAAFQCCIAVRPLRNACSRRLRLSLRRRDPDRATCSSSTVRIQV
jgi:hypothetical protein